eukprot:12901232-Prorocentrum_lima.AAC.1
MSVRKAMSDNRTHPELCVTRRYWARHYLKLQDLNKKANCHSVQQQSPSLSMTMMQSIRIKVVQPTDMQTYWGKS